MGWIWEGGVGEGAEGLREGRGHDTLGSGGESGRER